MTAPGRATATVWPAATFGAPQTICDGAPSPVSTRQTRQPVGVGMAAGLEHLADDEVLERGHAVRVHAIDLGPREREPLGQRERLQAGVAVVVQPQQGQPHPNCSRKRRSFSYIRRRSLTPCLRKAIRSIPMPKAKPWIRSGS